MPVDFSHCVCVFVMCVGAEEIEKERERWSCVSYDFCCTKLLALLATFKFEKKNTHTHYTLKIHTYSDCE